MIIVPDLVARLRTADTSATNIFKEAADEIERLRSDGSRFQACSDSRATYVADRLRDIAQIGTSYVEFDTEAERKAAEAIRQLRAQAGYAEADAAKYSRQLAEANIKIEQLSKGCTFMSGEMTNVINHANDTETLLRSTIKTQRDTIENLKENAKILNEANGTLHKKLQDERLKQHEPDSLTAMENAKLKRDLKSVNDSFYGVAAGATELEKRLEGVRKQLCQSEVEKETLKREFARVRDACDSNYVTADSLRKQLDGVRGDLRFLYKVAYSGVDMRCGLSKDDDFEKAVCAILNLHKSLASSNARVKEQAASIGRSNDAALARGVVITAERLRDLAKRGELQCRSPGGYFDIDGVREAEGAILQLRIDRDRDHSLIESFLGTVKNVWCAGEKK